MSEEVLIEVFENGILLFLKVVSPILIISVAVGLIISIFQAVTQLHEQTLTFAPKIIITFLALVLMFSWIMQNLSDFSFELFTYYLGMI
ncbi:flagellar biosynthesis protein FliQ [Petrotoga olearia]|uniref:Flagellar biosynthetic protein FliQ n=2 Tax=Petrotoga olearia TaxID=156203 RepID=A0A2K1P3P1_9BACT|nr:flagellar biosynthesis protein FliQ [Petrotoga olearia]KUK15377.1 MAG: Flagellar biosynthetic protein FliQ [Petrotoga mobilis]PNR97381.1 flagellar biosynthesis protein FliQ [Petrotoga olearia DSM 13574]RMA70543.1 flagellar biosynthetic protein FliQ [Petrotoga olearia]HBT51174.1 flagellar biosynthetic protein FliQ [Petrotoga sp.]